MKIKIPSVKPLNIPIFVIFIFNLFFTLIFIGLPESRTSAPLIVFTSLFNLLFILIVYVTVKKRNIFVSVKNDGIVIKQNSQSLEVPWDNILMFGGQLAVTKRMGVIEGHPLLAIKFKNSFEPPKWISTSEFGFYRKKSDLLGYFHKEDVCDLYISLAFATSDMYQSLFSVSNGMFNSKQQLPWIIKCNSELEYQQIKKKGDKTLFLMDFS